jgi:DNA ligase (NAD+)
VAVLTPTRLAGSVIKRATLHNQDEIKRKDIRIGDKVIIEKGGDVIPKIVKSLIDKRTGTKKIFHMPHTCPVCNSRVIKDVDEVAVKCDNLSCPAQIKKRIEHFASRDAMNIDTLGPAIIKQLVEGKTADPLSKKQLLIEVSPPSSPIKSLADIYSLSVEHLASLERMGLKSAKNLITAIEKSKDTTLSTFIYSLGIHHVGKFTAETLSRHYSTLTEIENATLAELEEITDIGPIVSKSIHLFFKNPENKKTIKNLLKSGINIKNEQKKQKLSNKTFVITGTLKKYSRIEAQNLIKNLGGNISNQISNKTDYLVVGNNPGSKLSKSKEKNIKILNEDEFEKIMKS